MVDMPVLDLPALLIQGLIAALTGPALGGILAVLHAAMDMKATIGGRLHRCARFLLAPPSSGILMPAELRTAQTMLSGAALHSAAEQQ